MPNFLASLSPAGTFTAGGTGTITAGSLAFGTNADRAVAVLVTSVSSDVAAVISSVVVGGVTLTAGANIDISNEYSAAGSKGRIFTGTGIPSGSQSVSINWANPNFVGHHVGYAAMAFDDAITLTITDAGAGTSGTAPTITLTSASGDLMAAFGAWQSDVRATVTAPSTEQFDALATANSGSFYGETQTASTTSTTLAATAASNTGGWRMWGLRVEGGAVDPVLTSEQGSYSLTGQDTSLKVTRILTASQGTYSLSGQDVTLTYTQPGAYTLTASQGSYTITGSDGLAQRAMNADFGSYTLTGQDTSFIGTLPSAYSMSAVYGTYSLTGKRANLLAPGDLPSLGDGDKFVKLALMGYTGALNDMLLAYYHDNGATSNVLNEAEMEFLAAQGASATQINNRRRQFYVSLGYTGNLNDMEYQYWWNL